MAQRASKKQTGVTESQELHTLNGQGELAQFLMRSGAAVPNSGRLLFVCIGSDRSTGDAYGPLVGSLLKERGWPHVVGTLEQPCDAHAVEAAVLKAAAMREQAWSIVAIDACLGKAASVGGFVAAHGPLLPGSAIGRRLPPVGDVSIRGVVNLFGPKAYGMLQTTSLHLVMEMAKQTAAAIDEAWLDKPQMG
ncbi:spore protease YyaC [Paenibacillus sp. PL2-23]|uniref:spore protease YyaC n=1 Tax=Paenibacillus sp. PL2-23 TaxID=2100729 RepID=UPI0030FCD228